MREEMRPLGEDVLSPGWVPPEIDTSRPHPARMYDYLLGGKDNFAVDREAAEVALTALPELRAMARANRAFLGRAVRHLAEAGITQFLDVGTGIPGPGNTGDVARAVHPDARVVYIDYDPIVVVHSTALLRGSDPAHTAVLQADVRKPEAILDDPKVREILDFTKPVAVLMVAVLHFVAEEEDAPGIVARFADALPAGGAVVISHATDGGQPERSKAARKGWDQAVSRLVVRGPEQIEALFDGLQVLEPGVVPLPLWRPDGDITDDIDMIWLNGGVGIKR